MTWILACPLDQVAEDGEAVKLTTVPPVAVFNSGGELFATADTCTHAAFSLSEGYVENATVECPVHLATFCLRTGRALKLPAREPLATYGVRVDGAQVLVDLPD